MLRLFSSILAIFPEMGRATSFWSCDRGWGSWKYDCSRDVGGLFYWFSIYIHTFQGKHQLFHFHCMNVVPLLEHCIHILTTIIASWALTSWLSVLHLNESVKSRSFHVTFWCVLISFSNGLIWKTPSSISADELNLHKFRKKIDPCSWSEINP